MKHAQPVVCTRHADPQSYGGPASSEKEKVRIHVGAGQEKLAT